MRKYFIWKRNFPFFNLFLWPEAFHLKLETKHSGKEHFKTINYILLERGAKQLDGTTQAVEISQAPVVMQKVCEGRCYYSRDGIYAAPNSMGSHPAQLLLLTSSPSSCLIADLLATETMAEQPIKCHFLRTTHLLVACCLYWIPSNLERAELLLDWNIYIVCLFYFQPIVLSQSS